MANKPVKKTASNGLDETIDAPFYQAKLAVDATDSDGATSASQSVAAVRKAARQRVELVEGSSPRLSTELRHNLRNRLYIASLLLFTGFFVFFIWSLFGIDYFQKHGNMHLFWIHAGVMALLGVTAWYLHRNSDLTSEKLLAIEAIVFGGPAFFFFVQGFHQLHFCCDLPEGQGFVRNPVESWVMLIFTYALFIPNTWKRALFVLTPLALAPVAQLYYAWFFFPKMAALLEREEFTVLLIRQPVVMALALISGVVGVYTINSLRKEAFEAKLLGQYRLKERLGSGGMGEVYLAEHQMMKRPCAVKIIRADKTGNPKTLARFEREVRLTAKLSHWNSIDIYDYGRTDDGTFYYVMEYLPGHNVEELVTQNGPLPPERIVHLMRQVCAALHEAHEIGLVHRDIKPANIFAAIRGGVFDVAKLLDFGLAKPMMAGTEDIALTLEGSITGSPLYMSPEQATAEEEVDARSDIYSLGAVMYYMLSGAPPFVKDNALQVVIAHASEPVPPISTLANDLPEDLKKIVMRCLEKKPEDRFQTVLVLEKALSKTTASGVWTSEDAAEWWECSGCPERKAFSKRILEEITT